MSKNPYLEQLQNEATTTFNERRRVERDLAEAKMKIPQLRGTDFFYGLNDVFNYQLRMLSLDRKLARFSDLIVAEEKKLYNEKEE